MNDTQHYQKLAAETWPLFERKLRQAYRFKKIKKFSLRLAGLAIVIAVLYSLNATFVAGHHPKIPTLIKALPDKKGSKPQSVLIPERSNAFQKSRKLTLVQQNRHEIPPRDSFAALLPLLQLHPFQTRPFTSLSGKYADLVLACTSLNLSPLNWSLQDNGHSLSAILDAKTLMIMNLMYGTEKMPAYPENMYTDSWFRPAFFPADQFIQISFYDVSEWIQEPLSVKVSVNRLEPIIRLDNRRTQTNLVNPLVPNNQLLTPSFRDIPITWYYTNKISLDILIQTNRYVKNVFIADRPAQAFNPFLFHRSDTLLVLSAQAERMTRLTMYGTLIDSKEITFKSKGLVSAKRKEMLLDAYRNELYIIAPTNFHFVFYKLDLASGIATQVYQTATVWKGAEFEIMDAKLHYTFNNAEFEISLEANQ
jgi:hypothetical protein